MFAKFLLLSLFALMLAGAHHFQPGRERSLAGSRVKDGPRLRLMTWNIGYADLEDDSRAQDKDLQAVADTILSHAPDAVALQELTGPEQLKKLLDLLKGAYCGAIANPRGGVDRTDAILSKQRDARFRQIPAGGKMAVAATFRRTAQEPEITFASAHADAFHAARRRAYAEDLSDWTRRQPQTQLIFIGGDFNFELDARNESRLYTDNLKNDSEAYALLLQNFRDLAREAGDTAINDRRIDYLFGPQESVFLRQAQILRAAAVGRMDHWPVLVEAAL
jgi:endonuclease/exonuclease/phosphatase family metal-dependent hydrolase